MQATNPNPNPNPNPIKAENPHVLNLSPPLDLDPRWFKLGGVAYTMAKYNMSMCAVGMAEEFRGQVAFNCLWPRTAIATAAVKMLAGEVCPGPSTLNPQCPTPSPRTAPKPRILALSSC